MAFSPENGAPYTPAVIYQAPKSSGGGGGRGPSRKNSVQKRQQKKQQTKVKDASGTNLITNDATGFGLKRPYIPWNSYPTNLETNPAAAPVLSTTSGVFTALLTCAIEPQHPWIRVRVRAVTGAATPGEVRLLDRATGQVIAGPLAVGAASTVEANLDGALINPTLSGAGAPYKVDVQARTTGGASTIAVLIVYVVGIGT